MKLIACGRFYENALPRFPRRSPPLFSRVFLSLHFQFLPAVVLITFSRLLWSPSLYNFYVIYNV